MSKKQQEWRNLVSKTFRTNKAKNKNYTFRQALKDSAKLKKNNKYGGGDVSEMEQQFQKKRSRNKTSKKSF
jgi:hypothetical protein